MKEWRSNCAAALMGAGSGLGGLLLAACRGNCSSCYGCIGGGLFGLVVLARTRQRKRSRKEPPWTG